MKKIFSLLIAIVVLTAIYSCKSDDDVLSTGINNNSTYYSQANVVSILKEGAVRFIEECPENDSVLVFSSSTPDDALPKVGSIIFVPISEKTPYGYLGKIASIDKGAQIKVYTTSVSLEEAFDNLSVDTVMNVFNKIESVLDAEGNPVEFEVMDSTLTESSNVKTRAGGYWQGGVIKFPFTIGKREDGHKLVGTIYAELKNFDFNVDIVNNEIRYIDVKADPTIKLSLTDKIEIKNKNAVEKSTLIGAINCAPITIPTPIAVPIILRPKLYLYLVYGATGEITASMSLQYQKSFETEMHWRGGQWTNKLFCKDLNNENPWVVTEFDVNGELYVGSKMGLLVGLYSATTGIGINVTPKISLGADAKLSTENLLDINPQVELAAKWSGELYFTASLFNRPIAHYSFSSPEYVAWSEKLYLFPQFSDFEAIGSSSSGEVSYKIDSHYFLAALGVKTGTRVYESDKKTVVNTYFPSKTNTDNKGFHYFNVNVEGLTPGSTYYAAPVCSWLGFTWPSLNKTKFTTEASYKFDFRCQSQTYDIISFVFNLNDNNSNSFTVNAEGQDYNNGPYFNAIVKGSLNKTTNTIDGTVEMNFIGLPEQRRIDAFSISLTDNNYVNTSKVLDNGACYSAIRITNTSDKTKMVKSYKGVKIMGSSDCNVGLSIY